MRLRRQLRGTLSGIHRSLGFYSITDKLINSKRSIF